MQRKTILYKILLCIFLIFLSISFNGCGTSDFKHKEDIMVGTKIDDSNIQSSNENIQDIINNLQDIDYEKYQYEILSKEFAKQSLMIINTNTKLVVDFDGDILYKENYLQNYNMENDYYDFLNSYSYYVPEKTDIEVFTKYEMYDIENDSLNSYYGHSLYDGEDTLEEIVSEFPNYNDMIKDEAKKGNVVLEGIVTIDNEEYYKCFLESNKYHYLFYSNIKGYIDDDEKSKIVFYINKNNMCVTNIEVTTKTIQSIFFESYVSYVEKDQKISIPDEYLNIKEDVAE